jgi:hypothetical protein
MAWGIERMEVLWDISINSGVFDRASAKVLAVGHGFEIAGRFSNPATQNRPVTPTVNVVPG